MAMLTDGKKYVDLYMGYSTGNGYTPDWSDDFFEVGGLAMDDEGYHIVRSVDYCIDQMEDWCDGRGDYCCAGDDDPHFYDRVIGVNTIKVVSQ